MIICDTYYKSSDPSMAQALAEILTDDTVIVCIGTDKCIGDSIGPLVGSMLKHYGWDMPIYGTLNDPVHGLNIERYIDTIKEEHPGQNVIAIDASLGYSLSSVGHIRIRTGAIKPGAGLGREITPIGDYSIIGIVDYKEANPMLMGIRLKTVMQMSDKIARALIQGYALREERKEMNILE